MLSGASERPLKLQVRRVATTLSPAHVKPYVRRNKSDQVDAAAIYEAIRRPGQRFVPVRSIENQAALMRHRARELLAGQRTAALNALRGDLAEIGVVAAQGAQHAYGLKRTGRRRLQREWRDRRPRLRARRARPAYPTDRRARRGDRSDRQRACGVVAGGSPWEGERASKERSKRGRRRNNSLEVIYQAATFGDRMLGHGGPLHVGGEGSCSACGNITKIYRWRPIRTPRDGLCGGRHFEHLLLTAYDAANGRGIFVDLGDARRFLLTNGVMATLAMLHGKRAEAFLKLKTCAIGASGDAV